MSDANKAFMIADDKITKYLLTVSANASTEAKGKSKLFRGIGFSNLQPSALSRCLSLHSSRAMLTNRYTTRYGERLVYDCNLPDVPNGRVHCIRTVWQERPDGNFWLATAYP